MIKILPISDIHIEFMRDYGRSFADHLDSTDVDVLVIAGDLGPVVKLGQNILNFFNRVCGKFKTVLWVLGNHCYYGSNFPVTDSKVVEICAKYNNLFCLGDGETFVHPSGQRFVGGTLWFRDDPKNVHYQFGMSDFQVIKNFTGEVYKRNAQCTKYLEANMKSGDVVITHHLPSEKSVSHLYKGSNLNRFFVCEIDSLIESRQPALYIHGHTHTPCDYTIGSTRVVCNPHGYVGENVVGFNPRLVIEV